jgi:hypothetical protein
MSEKNKFSLFGAILGSAILLTACGTTNDQTTVTSKDTTTPGYTEQKTEQPAETAKQPAETATEQDTGVLEMVSFDKSAKPGDEVTIKVKTSPKVKCKIEADGAGLTNATALMDKDADEQGLCFWKFKIDKNYKADKMPIIVTALFDGLDKKLVDAIEIQLPEGKAPDFNTDLSSLDKSARPGEEVTLNIKTVPNADVKLQAQGLGFEPGLLPKKADKEGNVSWKFKIDQDYKADQVPIIVTSKLKDKEEKEVTSIKLEKIAYTNKEGDKNL